MRFVMIAMILMVVATVATTPGVQNDLAGYVADTLDSADRERLEAGAAISRIPGRVIASLPLGNIPEVSSQPAPRPADTAEPALPETVSAALAPETDQAAAIVKLNGLAPAAGLEGDAAPPSPSILDRDPIQLAALPPTEDPLHSTEPDPRDLLVPKAEADNAIEAMFGRTPVGAPVTAVPEAPESAPAAETDTEAVAEAEEAPVLRSSRVVRVRPRPKPMAQAAPTPVPAATLRIAGLPLEPAAAPAVTPGESSGDRAQPKRLYIVIGSFLEPRHARQTADLHAAWQPEIRPAQVEGRKRFRVLVGPFSQADMTSALADIRRIAVPDAWPLRVPAPAATVEKPAELIKAAPAKAPKA